MIKRSRSLGHVNINYDDEPDLGLYNYCGLYKTDYRSFQLFKHVLILYSIKKRRYSLVMLAVVLFLYKIVVYLHSERQGGANEKSVASHISLIVYR
jgi:hypothetical protein